MDFSKWTPADWNTAFASIAVPLAVAIIALAATLWANELRRRDERRRDRALRILEFSSDMQVLVDRVLAMEMAGDATDIGEVGWKFGLLARNRRELWVAKWVWFQIVRLGDLLFEESEKSRRTKAPTMLMSTMTSLNEWRIGSKSWRWFRDEVKKDPFSKPTA